MAWAKRKLNFKKQDFFKKTPTKHNCSIVASKRSMIIKISSLSIIYHTTTILEKVFLNSPISKYKTKIIFIVHITEGINTPKPNVI